MRFLALLAVALPPVSGHAWTAVVNDWFDNGRFDHAHSCAAVVVAVTNGGKILPHAVRDYAHRVCHAGDATKITIGMSNATVAVVAGAPRFPISGPHCWTYTTRRVCFTDKRVSKVQFVTHGG